MIYCGTQRTARYAQKEKAVQKLEGKYKRNKDGLWKLLSQELDGAYEG